MNVVKALAILLVVSLLAGCAANWEPRAERLAGPDDNRPANEQGATAANILYAPGRALVCGGAAVLAFAVMAVTFGQDYTGASELMHGGCSGPWTLQAEDVR